MRRSRIKRALSARFYARPAEVVARELLGCVLISTVGALRTAGRIVETEAYVGPHDPASHAAERIGRTARNEAMYGVPGIAYIYRIYGVHWCLNAVTDARDYPAAVLIRALEPIEGLEVMRRRRHNPARALHDRELCSGPGRLAAALALDGTLDRHHLDQPPLWIERGAPVAEADIAATSRIGITRAADWPLRFHVRGSAWVSRR